MPDLISVPTLEQLEAEYDRYVPDGFALANRDAYATFGTYKLLALQGHLNSRAFVRSLYPQGYAELATGAWLDLKAADYGLTRIPERRTEGLVDFYVGETVTVPAGTVVQTPFDATGQSYRYVVPVATPCKPPMTPVLVRAETAGAAYNVGSARIATLVTVLDEVVRVANAASWITVEGLDRESDEALRRRIQLKWPERGSGSTYHAYESWAREVSGVTKVSILDQHPRGQGTLDVVIAPVTGPPSADLINEVNAIVQERRPITADALVRGPTLRPVSLTFRLYLTGPDLEGQEAWESRARAVIEALDIDEAFYPSRVADVFHNFGYVRGIDIAEPADPVFVSGGTLIVPGEVVAEIVAA